MLHFIKHHLIVSSQCDTCWIPVLYALRLNVISSYSPCKDGNSLFTTLHLKDLPDQAW